MINYSDNENGADNSSTLVLIIINYIIISSAWNYLSSLLQGLFTNSSGNTVNLKIGYNLYE